MHRITRLAPLLLLFTGACDDVEGEDDDHDHDHGLATTVVLTFTPAGGQALVFEWSDPEDDGSPVIDPIVLPDASTDATHAPLEYAMAVEVFNDLEDPVEEVTPEILDEADTHQFFFTGSAVQGPATGDNPAAVVEHDYDDSDADGLPVGLDNTFTTMALGTGELVVTLRHLPPENDAPIKVDGLAQDVADAGFDGIGGDTDIQITFDLQVE